MARTVEEKITNVVINAFGGNKKEVKPTKSYMAVSTSVPKVGERFKCRRTEKRSDGNIYFVNTETSTVQKVSNLAKNVFVVTTKNSYYVTRVLGIPVENVHFALVREKTTLAGYPLTCKILDFASGKVDIKNWKTSTVQEVKYIFGLYKVITCNSIYVCLPL